MRSDDRNMKTMKPRDRKMKTLDEERKEQAFYEATEKFLPIDMQDLIWERFLARCVCGRCGGIPTYNMTNVEQTVDGPCVHSPQPALMFIGYYPCSEPRTFISRESTLQEQEFWDKLESVQVKYLSYKPTTRSL